MVIAGCFPSTVCLFNELGHSKSSNSSGIIKSHGSFWSFFFDRWDGLFFTQPVNKELEWWKLWGKFLEISVLKCFSWWNVMSGSQENGLMLRTVRSCQLGLKKAFFSGILYQNYPCLRGIFSVCEAFSPKNNLSKVVGSKGEASDFLEEKTLARLLGLDSKGERFYDLSPPWSHSTSQSGFTSTKPSSSPSREHHQAKTPSCNSNLLRNKLRGHGV